MEDEKIQTILKSARYSPFGTNMQPWPIACQTDQRLYDLCIKYTTFQNVELAIYLLSTLIVVPVLLSNSIKIPSSNKVLVIKLNTSNLW